LACSGNSVLYNSNVAIQEPSSDYDLVVDAVLTLVFGSNPVFEVVVGGHGELR